MRKRAFVFSVCCISVAYVWGCSDDDIDEKNREASTDDPDNTSVEEGVADNSPDSNDPQELRNNVEERNDDSEGTGDPGDNDPADLGSDDSVARDTGSQTDSDPSDVMAPDSSAFQYDCQSLVKLDWSSCSLTVIRDGDGLAQLNWKGSYDDPDAGPPAYGLYAHDAAGNIVQQISSDIPDVASCSASLSLVKAKGALIAGMVDFVQKGPCANVLFANDREPKYVEPGSQDLFWNASETAAMAIGSDNTLVTLTINNTRPSGSGSAFFLLRFDAKGNIVDSKSTAIPLWSYFQILGMEIDEKGRIFILIEGVTNLQTEPNPDLMLRNSIVAFDGDFNEIGRWESPQHVRIGAILPDEQGHLIVVGSSNAEGEERVLIILLDGASLKAVWPEAKIQGKGQALGLDLTESGDMLVVGWTTEDQDTLWLNRFDANGLPLWPKRVETAMDYSGWPIYNGSMLQPKPAAVSEQSDGSILISALGEAFFYCE